MNSRELLRDTLNHRQPERVVVDFGGTLCSGMHVTCVAALRDYYGLGKRTVKVNEPYQMLGLIEDDLKKAIGIDTEAVNPMNTMFGFRNDNWKEWQLDNGLDVLVPGEFNITNDEKGDHYIYPEGDMSAPPSGHMPKDGYYFDAIVRQEEIDDDNIDIEDNLEEYKPITKKEIDYYIAALTEASATGRGVIANFGGTGLGDIALVPGPFMKNPKGIRDVEEWYISTVTRKEYIKEVFERQTDIALGNLKKLNSEVGEMVDAVFVCGTDFGTQISTFCSRETFTDLYMPYYKKINGWIHKNTGWKTFKHSCGAIESFMDLFIESEFDIINPVQCSADGMDAELIKRKYGDRLAFWGGGVDTQKVLPFGNPKEIRKQVIERCRIFSKDGGFVFSAIHNVQAGVPTENIVAMIDAVKEFNGER